MSEPEVARGQATWPPTRTTPKTESASSHGPSRRGPGQDALPEIGLLEIIQADPREAHLVDGALAVTHPVLRIGIELVVVGVVVPGSNVNDRAGGQQRSHIIRSEEHTSELQSHSFI